MYIWECQGWPKFRWNVDTLLGSLASARLKQGRLLGTMVRLGFDLKREAQLASSLSHPAIAAPSSRGATSRPMDAPRPTMIT